MTAVATGILQPLDSRETRRVSKVQSSHIGPVPDGWDVVAIGDLLEFKNGLNKGKSHFGHGTPIVNYMDVYANPGLKAANVMGRVDVSKQEIDAFSVHKGDIFFTRTSETREEVGLASVMLEDIEDAVFSGFLLIGRPKCDTLEDDFKRYCFLSRSVRFQIISKATYTTRALTNGKALSRVLVAIPKSRSEQLAIAGALGDADNCICSIDELIKKKQRIRQGLLCELLTGKRRLPGFETGIGWRQTEIGTIPMDWGLRTLRNLLSHSATYGVVKAGGFQRRGIPMLRGGDIKHGRINQELPLITHEKSIEYQRTILRTGDVVIALVGYPGEAACVPEWLAGANISRAVGLLRPGNSLIAEYLVCYLNSSFGRGEFLKLGAGSAQMVVNLKDLNLLRVPLPPTPQEQKAIAEVFADMDNEIVALGRELEKARYIKQGLMQELLTGRVRLV